MFPLNESHPAVNDERPVWAFLATVIVGIAALHTVEMLGYISVNFWLGPAEVLLLSIGRTMYLADRDQLFDLTRQLATSSAFAFLAYLLVSAAVKSIFGIPVNPENPAPVYLALVTPFWVLVATLIPFLAYVLVGHTRKWATSRRVIP